MLGGKVGVLAVEDLPRFCFLSTSATKDRPRIDTAQTQVLSRAWAHPAVAAVNGGDFYHHFAICLRRLSQDSPEGEAGGALCGLGP